jgi:hypothetical protein
VIVKAQNNKTSTLRDRLRLAGMPMQIRPAKPTPTNVAPKKGRGVDPGLSRALDGAVVVTVSVVWPAPTTELGLNLQAAPFGKPEQELELKAMVPA